MLRYFGAREPRLCNGGDDTLLDFSSRPADRHGLELLQVEFLGNLPATGQVNLEDLNPFVIERKVDEEHLVEAPLADHLRGEKVDPVRGRRHKEAAGLL